MKIIGRRLLIPLLISITLCCLIDYWLESVAIYRTGVKYRFLIRYGILVGVFIVFLVYYFLNGNMTEKALLVSEERYQNLFKTTLDIIFFLSDTGRITSLNKGFEKTTGFNRAQLIGEPFSSLVSPEDRPLMETLLQQLLKTGKPVTVELTMCSKKIAPLICEVTLTKPAITKKSQRIIGIARNITERKKAENDLATQKERLAVTLRSIGDGVIATDTGGKISLMNPVAEYLTGWTFEKANGEPLEKIFRIINENREEVYENPVKKVLETGESAGLAKNTILMSKDDHERYISNIATPIKSNDGKIIGAVLVFRDISERRKSEEEMLKNQKLESIGILAGGIAHDFNNILAGILANAQLAKIIFVKGQDIQKYLTGIEEAVSRATALTKQLLTFSKGGAPIKRIASIADLIQATVDFTLRGSNVRYELFLPANLWSAEIDTGQISQVINNLIINAYQAMPEGGTIKVAAENITVENDGTPLPKGNYVKIAVRDYGMGIAEENLPFIFDPYFTTKANGTGLGLATSYSIIKRHDGFINAESQVNLGTTFNVYLPAAVADIVGMLDKQGEVLQQGAGRILLMDDDEVIRDVAGEMLKLLGYEVEVAKDGQEVLDLFQKKELLAEKPIDAVIMDLTIPGGMGGKYTIEKLQKIAPQIKVIVSSGYSNNPLMAEYEKYGFSGVVVKPYKIEELSKILHAVLKKGKVTAS